MWEIFSKIAPAGSILRGALYSVLLAVLVWIAATVTNYMQMATRYDRIESANKELHEKIDRVIERSKEDVQLSKDYAKEVQDIDKKFEQHLEKLKEFEKINIREETKDTEPEPVRTDVVELDTAWDAYCEVVVCS